MKIGVVTGGVGTTTTFNLSYVPEFIRFIAATRPQSLKVNVLGVGVICDLDAAGILSVGSMRKASMPTNGYEIPLCDGLIEGRNCEIIVTNGQAAAFDLFVDSSNKGGLSYIRSLRQTIFGSTPFDAIKFAYLGLGNVQAADQIDVTFADGTVQKVEPAELGFFLASFQTDSQNVKGIDNIDGWISKVRFIPAANQTIYIVDYQLTAAGSAFQMSNR